uniref:RHOMBOID-like protein n=1 Tax=Oryza sativa subsp. japonica TaxID=39947 RepID=Q336Z9_ORYSJ|nr:Rhomboid family protein, expressed [Oryza sativa Japonica Group]
MGALVWDKVVHEHQGWRLVTCIWLHAGVVHLLANMLSLVLIGLRLEQQFGYMRIGIIYLVSGIGGSVLSSLFIRNSISVGASGALFGLLGAMLSELFTNWTIYTNKVTFSRTFSAPEKKTCILTLVIFQSVHAATSIRLVAQSHMYRNCNAGCSSSDALDRHRDQPRHRHPPSRRQLRPHRRVLDWVPPRIHLPDAPTLRMDAAICPAFLCQVHLQEVPGLSMDLAGRGLGPSCHRIRRWAVDALQRGEC